MVKIPNKILQLIILVVACMTVFTLSLRPVSEYDTYFGITIGKRIVETKTFSSIEPYSWSAEGRQGNLYEWLAHVTVYLISTVGGMNAIQMYVALMTTAIFLLFYVLCIHIFRRDFITSLILSLIGISSIFEFCVARPQLISFLFMLIYLSIVLKKNFRFLWLTLPITYFWTNMHASFLLGPLLLASYAAVAYFKNELILSKKLAIYFFLNIFITLLPPVSFQPYTLLFSFLGDAAFLQKFISEWAPLVTSPYLFISYSMLWIITLGSISISFLKKQQTSWVSLLPLVIITFLPFTAVRHIPYGVISCITIIGLTLPPIKWKQIIPRIVLMILITLSFWLMVQKRADSWRRYREMPVGAVEFLKTQHIKGHMFNQFAIGGYLMNKLYPSYQIFFDGRAEIYRMHEMRDFYPLLVANRSSQEEFTKTLDQFLNMYGFSFIILPISLHNPLTPTTNERMADILLDLPDWTLVYLDDQSEIFVKKDGKNDDLIRQFGTSFVTPYRVTSYRVDATQAKKEYEQFARIQPSSIAYTGIGDFEALQRAIEIDPTNGQAYLSLARLLHSSDQKTARLLYEKTMRYTPYIGEAYVEAAKLCIAENDLLQARKYIRKGLAQTIPFLSRRDLILLENTIKNY